MGNTKTTMPQINAKESLGFPRGNKRLEQFAKKASQTFPPKFTGVAQTGSVESVEGNRAVITGRIALKTAGYNVNAESGFTTHDYPTVDMLQRELDGPEGLFTLSGCHYIRMFADPRMNVLFDTRFGDSAVSALEHGKRVASALLDRWYGTSYFGTLQRDASTAFFQVTPTHRRAKGCPLRPVEHQKHKKFTMTQRDAWIGHVICAAEEVGTSKQFQDALGKWLAKNIDVYAPFVDDYEDTKDIQLIE